MPGCARMFARLPSRPRRALADPYRWSGRHSSAAICVVKIDQSYPHQDWLPIIVPSCETHLNRLLADGGRLRFPMPCPRCSRDVPLRVTDTFDIGKEPQ
jgi:hypothetical protein